MDWSLSEYLNLIELRSQTWCMVDLAQQGGFRIPHSEGVLFYGVLEGQLRLSWDVGQCLTLRAGEIAILLSGSAHTARASDTAAVPVLKFLADGEYADAPHHFSFGRGPAECRVLCGRLKARWPGAKRPPNLPPLLQTTAEDNCLDLNRLVQKADMTGGNSMLTRAAMFVFISTFRSLPSCENIFRASGLREPIAQAMQFIETHPFTNWTVARLASKVGMGRSNFALRFTEDVGRTPMTYVTEQRMKHAALFLERTDLKIAEVAERIGYRSESAFSHRFVAHFGMTPGELRNRRRRSPAKSASGQAQGGLAKLHVPRRNDALDAYRAPA